MTFSDRPYVFLKVATSLDGCLDDISKVRLVFSPPEDMAAVDRLRSEFDGILVGAETIRKDNPRLVLRDEHLRKGRSDRGTSPDPTKICLTASGALDPASAFFKAGDCDRLVYASEKVAGDLRSRLGGVATIISMPTAPDGKISLPRLLVDLKQRGISRLFVEGGAQLIRCLFQADTVDAMRVAVSSKLVVEAGAPRFFDGSKDQAPKRKFFLEKCETFSEMFVLSGVFHPL